MKKKALAVVNNGQEITQSNTPADMIRMAVAGKADLDKLERLLQIQKDWEANEARKIFTDSFARAQENIAAVIKTKLNPQTHSKYASLENIIESAKPVYTKEGFSVIFYEGETATPEHIRICADVLHKAGHKETYHYDVPMDGKGIQGNANMTKIHAKASSTSYGRRYLMCMIWNIPTMDDDGNAAGPVEYIDMQQQGSILDFFNDMSLSDKEKTRFFSYMKCESIDQIQKKDFNKAIAALEAGKKVKAGVK